MKSLHIGPTVFALQIRSITQVVRRSYLRSIQPCFRYTTQSSSSRRLRFVFVNSGKDASAIWSKPHVNAIGHLFWSRIAADDWRMVKNPVGTIETAAGLGELLSSFFLPSSECTLGCL